MVDMISAGTLPCAASACSGSGQVKLSLSYASKEKKLIVLVHACRCASSNRVPNHFQSDCVHVNDVNRSGDFLL